MRGHAQSGLEASWRLVVQDGRGISPFPVARTPEEQTFQTLMTTE